MEGCNVVPVTRCEGTIRTKRLKRAGAAGLGRGDQNARGKADKMTRGRDAAHVGETN